ncbi:sensor histidine kinase [Mongoliitalea daihaiensis]|uniref:sensor histidine kinase n=1 Tax=Mongoliitalea daihaiensis TaxID=2782006 RepID=UPI00293E1853|nr:sensor histidine kinase [Mongoliitalea daihaiensis]
MALLFAIAWFSERSSEKGESYASNPYVYALSLAVYCTAWTYYGSVGYAATNGLEFLTIYIGPSLIAPLWWLVMRKMIRVSKVQRISSIADFISSRYGKSVSLGGIVTVFCLLGILPYISIQIKAIASSFEILTTGDFQMSGNLLPFYSDAAFYLSLGLALFTILFGTRDVEATARHDGLVTAIAFESIFKLVAFLVVGVFVTFIVYDGFQDIFTQASIRGFDHLFVFGDEIASTDWFWMGILSMMAILFLPRQFQVSVVENHDENHLDKAMWLFPLYLLIINVFVLPIALGGLVHFEGEAVDADTFVLALPITYNQDWLALGVYLGGFSAATGMIIVSTIALSNMVSNNLVLPVILSNDKLKKKFQLRLGETVIWIRRVTIILIIILAYAYYKEVAGKFSIVSIGLISFVAIAQLTPAIIGGLFWKKGSKIGATVGIIAGFGVWFFTLVTPTIVTAGYLPETFLSEGLMGIAALKPSSLFGMEGMSPISHGLFFSLTINTFAYVFLSLLLTQSSKEHNQAVVFVDIFKYSTTLDSSIIWKGQAYLPDLKALLVNFLGQVKTDEALQEFEAMTGSSLEVKGAVNSELVNYSERLLSGVIGTASARIMVASVVKEEEISMEEVLGILRETQELKFLNLELKQKSKELTKASTKLQKLNETLRLNDMLKDEFISTVTHEMKTPLTSIRAFSEILLDEDLPEEDRKKFLDIIIQETSRMTRLIDQVLDLERFDSGRQKLNLESTDIKILLLQACESMFQVFKEKKIAFTMDLPFDALELAVDEDRVKQVVLNLLSNASKFANSLTEIRAVVTDNYLQVEVYDDGKGVPAEEVPYIFDKFFQAKNQTSKKPIGSGLGLAISKKIIEYHGGIIGVERKDGLTCFSFSLPLFQEKNVEPETQKMYE